jgi:hypothetical protein
MIVIANQAPALTALPTNVHEKLARKLKPVGELGSDVFKRIVPLWYEDWSVGFPAPPGNQHR